ncbi:MAG: alpha-amylase family glycosyl hydrolase [Candidatus Limnocylindria bacterium]
MTTPSTRPGMGALPYPGGTTFRVWAPHAEAVFVTGTFDGWAGASTGLARDDDGSAETWSADVPGVEVGAEYRFTIRSMTGETLSRMDPYGRQVTSSVGNSVVYDPDAFDWGDDALAMPGWDDLVIYELHVGTFATGPDRRGDFDHAARRLPYLRDLGISAVQVMPPFEFAGELSWGYNPAHLFAIESGYGGPDAFKRFIRAAHEHGIAVIVDVVFNHLGPSDLDLWRFDGWSEDGGGGIYVYQDERAETPWGSTRPDYGRGAVRTFLRDSALTWLEEFRCDGLRFDSTLYIRTVDGDTGNPDSAIEDGWSFLAWINDEIRTRQPWKLTIAEDLRDDPAIVAPTADGGAGFGAQWDAGFVRRVRAALTASDDAERSIGELVEAIAGEGRGPAATRVIYTESHDEVANGAVRLPEAISPGDAASWWARKRATLGSALVMTAPGIPMLFQGQELLEDRWFDDSVALDWSKAGTHEGILRLHRDLISLRRGGDGRTRGLRGEGLRVLRADDEAKLLAFHRRHEGGPGDDVVVVANFRHEPVVDVRLGFPRGGRWRVRLNADWPHYSRDFGGQEVHDLDADGEPADGCGQSGVVSVGPYGVVILSQDP